MAMSSKPKYLVRHAAFLDGPYATERLAMEALATWKRRYPALVFAVEETRDFRGIPGGLDMCLEHKRLGLE